MLALLASALESIDGDSKRRNRVRGLRGKPLGLLLEELSVLERETSDVNSVRLIALAKQVLAGRRASEEFVMRCRRVIGMM